MGGSVALVEERMRGTWLQTLPRSIMHPPLPRSPWLGSGAGAASWLQLPQLQALMRVLRCIAPLTSTEACNRRMRGVGAEVKSQMRERCELVKEQSVSWVEGRHEHSTSMWAAQCTFIAAFQSGSSQLAGCGPHAQRGCIGSAPATATLPHLVAPCALCVWRRQWVDRRWQCSQPA